jgi:hypothetical protein
MITIERDERECLALDAWQGPKMLSHFFSLNWPKLVAADR